MEISRILEELRAERGRIDEAIRALEAVSPSTRPAKRTGSADGRRRRRRMSAAGRKRISEAMKKRWAERKKRTKAA